MTDRDRELARIRNPVLVIITAAWILLLAGSGPLMHCAIVASGVVSWQTSFHMIVAMNPSSALAKNWALMLIAMMSPVLIPPIRHVWLQSFRHRRTRSIGLFVAGYALIWLGAGALLLAAELSIVQLARQWYLPAAALPGLLWQFSPIKQHCLNRCHAYTPLASFGFAADRDAFRFGVNHGMSCVGSCWALMMFPMLLPRWQFSAMLTVAFLILSERLDQPVWPRWNWRISSKLMRIIFAQTRIRLIHQTNYGKS
jgi:predicted metal-binding membrane protein